MANGLSQQDILKIANRWIGEPSPGFLGDFTYKTHKEFYPEFCGLDFDPESLAAQTTRNRFIAILSQASPREQAAIFAASWRDFRREEWERRRLEVSG